MQCYCIFTNHAYALALFNLLDRGLPLLWQQRVNFRLADPNGKKLQDLACLEGTQQNRKVELECKIGVYSFRSNLTETHTGPNSYEDCSLVAFFELVTQSSWEVDCLTSPMSVCVGG